MNDTGQFDAAVDGSIKDEIPADAERSRVFSMCRPKLAECGIAGIQFRPGGDPIEKAIAAAKSWRAM